jgi:hypothetical protein
MGDYKMDDATKMSRQYGYDTLKMQQKEFYELMPYMTQEDRAKIGTGRQNEIDLTGYKQFMDQSKAKAAAIALNPNLSGTESIKDIGGTYKEATDLLSSVDSDGNKTIVDSPLTQAKIVDIIKARPDLFPNISSDVITSLKPEHIQIGDNEIEVDQITGPSTTYAISQAELLKAVYDSYMKSISSANPMDAANQSIMNATGATGLDAAAE